MYKKNSNNWLKHIDFILLDIICLEVSLYIACIIRHGFSNPLNNQVYRNLFLVVALLNCLLILIFDFFDGVLKRGYYKELEKVLIQALALLLSVTTYAFITQQGQDYSRIIIALSVVIYVMLTYFTRLVWKKALRKRMGKKLGDALIIITDRSDVQRLIKEVRENNYAGNQIVGIVFPNLKKQDEMIDQIPVVADIQGVADYVRNHWVDEILVSVKSEELLSRETLDLLISMGVTVHMDFSQTLGNVHAKQSIGSIGGLRVLSLSMNYMTQPQRFAKRFIDIIGGIAGCLCTGILYLIVAPAIKKESPGPVFFSQVRVGQNGKLFKLHKFRSMYLDAEERKKELMKQNQYQDGLMFKMEFDPRIIGNRIDENGNKISGIGAFIRHYSIDEFPQFWNVLKGEMSLVGTRPPLPEEYERYSVRHKARLAVKPGITGLWQISGRSNILDFEQVVKYDTEYINNWSVGLDLKIILRTFKVVLFREGSK